MALQQRSLGPVAEGRRQVACRYLGGAVRPAGTMTRGQPAPSERLLLGPDVDSGGSESFIGTRLSRQRAT